MKFISFCLSFCQWLIIYTALLVLAMETGVLAGPRIRFSFSSLGWIIFAVAPVGIAILLTLAFSYKKIQKRFHWHAMPYIAIVGMAMLATLMWGWMFEITAAYIIVHLVIAVAIDIVEFTPRIHSAVRPLY